MSDSLTPARFPIRPEHEASSAFTHTRAIGVHKPLFAAVGAVGAGIGLWENRKVNFYVDHGVCENDQHLPLQVFPSTFMT